MPADAGEQSPLKRPQKAEVFGGRRPGDFPPEPHASCQYSTFGADHTAGHPTRTPRRQKASDHHGRCETFIHVAGRPGANGVVELLPPRVPHRMTCP